MPGTIDSAQRPISFSLRVTEPLPAISHAQPLRPLPFWLALAILLVATFAAFWPILPSGWSQWDDWEQLAVNQYLNPPSWKGLGKRWAAPFMNIWIPLPHTIWFGLSFLAQSPTGEPPLDPLPFKILNVVTHGGTSFLVFLILAKLFPSRLIALLGAALFCLHPVQVESVGWTSGFKDLLFGFFACACIYFYLGDAKRGFELSGRALGTAITMMMLACLSKPTALVIPAMLLVIDLFIARRPVATVFSRLVPFIILAVACAAYARYIQPPIDIGVKLSLLDRLLVPAHSLAFYLFKLIWPARLAFDYGLNWDAVRGSRALYIAWIFPLTIAMAAWFLRKRFPLLGIGLLLAIIPIGPVSGVTLFDYSYYSITADHYLYLPMLGVAMAVAALLEWLSVRTALSSSAPLLIVLGALTTRQSFTWADGLTTTMHTLAVNPNSFSSYSILSMLKLGSSGGDPAILKDAEADARKSISMRADNPRAHNMLANVLAAQGRYEEALPAIDRALEIVPYDWQYLMARGGILGELNRGEESIASVRKALSINPDHKLARELVDKWDALARERRRSTIAPATIPAATTAPAAR